MKMKIAAVLATMAFGIAACGSDYDRDQAIEDLEEAGMTNEQAVCIVDKAEDEFGIEKLESTDDLTEEDEAAIMEITTACMGL